MKITRHLAIISVLAYFSVMHCPVVEFKPEEVFKPETDPKRVTEALKDPEFLRVLDSHIETNKSLTQEQINLATDRMLKSVETMQNSALKAKSIQTGLDIISKTKAITPQDQAAKAERIVKGLGIAAETGVDVSVKGPIITKGLEVLAKNNLLVQPALAENPSFIATLKNVLQTFKNAETQASAENILSMLDATRNAANPALHDIIFDTAVDLMDMRNKQGSLINNKGRAQLISDASQLITKQAIEGKNPKQVLNQIARIEQFILTFADATSIMSDPERTSLNMLQNAITQYNFPLPSHAAAIASLKAKINLIEAFNSGKVQETIPALPADTFTQAFATLTPLDNGRTFVDIFFEKVLAADRNTLKLNQMKPEQKEALFKAATNQETLKKLSKQHVLELFRPNGPIESTLKAIWDDKNPQTKGHNAIESIERINTLSSVFEKSNLPENQRQQINNQLKIYATALFDALKTVKFSEIKAQDIAYLDNLLTSNPYFLDNMVDFTAAKAKSLVSEEKLKSAQERIKSGKATAQEKADTESKEAQNESNINFIANMLSSLIKNTALTADQVSTLTYATQTLLNRISEPKILTKIVEIFGNNLSAFPEKIRSTIFAQMLNHTSLINIDQKTFDNVIAPTIIKTLVSDPARIDTISTDMLAKLLLNNQQEPAKQSLSIIAQYLKSSLDNAIKDPKKQEQALNTVSKITELTMLHLQPEGRMNETISLLSLALDYLARSGQGLALMNQPESYWYDPQKNFLSQVTLSGQLLKTVRDIQKTALDPKLLNEFNKQLIAYAQAINIKEPGKNINTWSIKQNITRAISNLLERPSIELTGEAKDVLLQSSMNFVRGASAIRGKDNKLDLKEFYKNPFKTGPEFSRYEYLGDFENILSLLLNKKAKFNEADFKTLQAFKNQDIEAFRKAIQANDFHSEIDPSSSKAQQELAQKNTEATKAIILKELDALSARIDLLEALQKRNYDAVASLTPRALQEFPVFGEEGTTTSFAHYIINDILPKMNSQQAATMVNALWRPEMQVQLPRTDYVALMTSQPVINVIQKAGTSAKAPLENTLKALNDPKIFDQKKLFDNRQIETLQKFINTYAPKEAVKSPKEYASISKSTALD